MRIAHVVASYPPYRGGLGNVAREYAEGLCARGHDVAVFTPDYGGANVGHAQPATVAPTVHRLRTWLRSGQCAFLPRLVRALTGHDLVHLHFPFYGAAQFVAWARARGHVRRLVLTYHMDAFASGWRGAVFAAHRRTMLPWIVRRADRILVGSRDYARHAALARVGGVQQRIEEHPFGVDACRFAPGDSSAARARLRLPEAPTVGFVGGLDRAHAFKGLEVLLTALVDLPADVQLAVVGDGDLRAGHAARARALGVGARVHFLGSVSDAALPDAYRAADVVAFPSTSRAEAFGLVALEAAASGRAVVASALPGVRTVVQDGTTGRLVPPGDAVALAQALRDVLVDGGARARLGAQARARVERELTWAHALDRLLATYADVLRSER